MKLLIIGHGRHGKDSVAELLASKYGCKFMSSTEFATETAVWPFAKDKGVWASSHDLFNDRSNHRELFYHAIRAYNLVPGKTLAEQMLDAGYDCYVGLRSREELNKCKHLFDYVIWVGAEKRLPLEPISSMELTKEDADYIIDNNSTPYNLELNVVELASLIGLSKIE